MAMSGWEVSKSGGLGCQSGTMSGAAPKSSVSKDVASRPMYTALRVPIRIMISGAINDVTAIPIGYAAKMRPSTMPLNPLPGGTVEKKDDRKVAIV